MSALPPLERYLIDFPCPKCGSWDTLLTVVNTYGMTLRCMDCQAWYHLFMIEHRAEDLPTWLEAPKE